MVKKDPQAGITDGNSLMLKSTDGKRAASVVRAESLRWSDEYVGSYMGHIKCTQLKVFLTYLYGTWRNRVLLQRYSYLIDITNLAKVAGSCRPRSLSGGRILSPRILSARIYYSVKIYWDLASHKLWQDSCNWLNSQLLQYHDRQVGERTQLCFQMHRVGLLDQLVDTGQEADMCTHKGTMIDGLGMSSLLSLEAASRFDASQLVGGPHSQTPQYGWLVGGDALVLVGDLVASNQRVQVYHNRWCSRWSKKLSRLCQQCHIRCPLLPSLESLACLLFLGKGSIQLDCLEDWTDLGTIWLLGKLLGGSSPAILAFQLWETKSY